MPCLFDLIRKIIDRQKKCNETLFSEGKIEIESLDFITKKGSC